MTDHPVLIPTSEGPVGGIVSEPDAEVRAGLLLLPGWGQPARSGVNSFWTRMARSLAALGIVTLRFDYSREGETLPLGEGGGGQVWKHDLDLRLLTEVKPWFRARTGDAPLFLAGACSGARLSIELAGREPGEFAGSFLIVPYLRPLGEPADAPPAPSGDGKAVDPLVVNCLRASLDHSPSWLLTGERDTEDIPQLLRLLPSTAHDLEVQIQPGAALHFLDQPHLQEQATAWLTSRISSALDLS